MDQQKSELDQQQSADGSNQPAGGSDSTQDNSATQPPSGSETENRPEDERTGEGTGARAGEYS